MIGTAVDLDYADGSYDFDLKLPQLAELQEKCGCGVFKLYGRVLKGRYIFEGTAMVTPGDGEAYDTDLFETIRLGLLGGGGGIVDGERVEMTPTLARKLVERYSVNRPLMESWAMAAAILGARIHGYEPPKKAGPAEQPASTPTAST